MGCKRPAGTGLAINGLKTGVVCNLKKIMYTSHRLEWHQDVGREFDKPRRVLCGLARQQAELLIRVIRFAVALAKSQDHRASCGVFAFGDRTPHVSKHLNRGGAEEKRSQYAERLGGSSRIIWSAGRIIKPRGVAIASMMILFNRGEVPFLSALRCGVGGSLGEINQ